MNKGRKSFLAMLLALAMTLSMIPATAFAEVKGNVQADASKTVSVTPVDSLSTGEKYIIATKDEESGTYYALSTLASDQKDGTGTNAHYLIGYAIAMTAVTGANSVITGFTVDENDANNLYWDCTNTGTGSGYSSARMKGVNKNNTTENELYISGDIKYQNGRDIRYANNEMYGHSGSSGDYYVVFDKSGLTSNEICFKTDKTGEKTRAKIYFFKFNAPEYTVSFNVRNKTEAVAPASQTVKEGNKATKPPTPVDPAGKYAFVTWCSDSGLTTPYDFDTAVTTSIQLYAKWEEATAFEKVESLSEEDDGSRYLITATSGDKVYALSKESSGTSLGTAVEVTPDDNDTIKAAASSLAWTYFNISSSSYFVNADLASTNVLYLGNGALRYNGTYNNGAVTGATAVNYTEAQKMQNASSTTRYVGISESPAAFTCVTSNSGNSAPVITLYKEVVASDTFKVTYDSNGGSGTVTDDNAYAPKATVTVKDGAGTKTGYTFAGWKAGDNVYQPNATFQITQNTKLTAQWTANTYTVQFDKGEAGATGTMGNQTFTYDAAQNLNENKFSYEGYAFEGWKNGNSTELISDKASVKNLTAENNGTVKLTAQWKQNDPPAEDVTISVKPVNSFAEDGSSVGEYIIAAKDAEGNYYALSKKTVSNRIDNTTYTSYGFAEKVTVNNNTVKVASDVADNLKWTCTFKTSDNLYYFWTDSTTSQRLYLSSQGKGGLKTGSADREIRYADNKMYTKASSGLNYVIFNETADALGLQFTGVDTAEGETPAATYNSTIYLFKISEDQPGDDAAAAEAVEALIDALPAAADVTLDNKAAIEAAQKAYDDLTDEQKSMVDETKLAKLTDVVEALATAQAAADAEAANTVKGLIDALPAAADVTLDDQTAIEAARAAYNALSEAQKDLIDNTVLQKLTDAEAALDALQDTSVISVTQVDTLTQGKYIIVAKTVEDNKDVYHALSKDVKTIGSYTSFGVAKTVEASLSGGEITKLTVDKDLVDNLTWVCTTNNSDTYLWTADVGASNRHSMYISGSDKGGIKYQSDDRPVYFEDGENLYGLNSDKNKKYYVYYDAQAENDLQFTTVASEGLDDKPGAEYNATIYLLKVADDSEIAGAVTDQLNDLPVAANVTLDDKAAIEAARDAYNNLTPAQKALINEDTLKKLTDAEEALAALEKAAADAAKAKTVSDAINALPSAAYVQASDKADIEAARKAYDALTADQKKLVDDSTLKKLTDAEAALAAVEKAEQDTAKAKAAADAINALPSAANVKASDKAAIEAARKAYDALTPDQKKLINEGTLKKLTDAEAALKALDGNTPKDDTAATKSAKAVTDQINALPANITLSNKDAVAAARKAYNALSAEAKAKVSSATLAKLTKAEQTIKDLQEYDAAVNSAKKIKAKLKSVKAQKGRKALVKWKKVKDVSGYEIRYSTKKSFKKGVKKAKVKKGTTTKKTIKKLKAGKTYYVQIRTIKKVPNKATGTTTLVYGKWSNKKKVKAKN